MAIVAEGRLSLGEQRRAVQRRDSGEDYGNWTISSMRLFPFSLLI